MGGGRGARGGGRGERLVWEETTLEFQESLSLENGSILEFSAESSSFCWPWNVKVSMATSLERCANAVVIISSLFLDFLK